MYYELFDEIRYAVDQKSSITWESLINKSLIDSFYDVRSEIQPIYNAEQELTRLSDGNYTYLFYQKIINGIAKGIFVGAAPGAWMKDMFLPNGRIRISSEPIKFYLSSPSLFVKNGEDISFKSSHLAIWEDELMKIAPDLNQKLGITITREGFKANLYRILELTLGLRSQTAKRAHWVEFLHELIVHGKLFSHEDLKKKFAFSDIGEFFRITDPTFKSHSYLEYDFYSKLGVIGTESFSDPGLNFKDPLKNYSLLNESLIGKIPLTQYFLTGHLFIWKEEFSLNQYYEFFVQGWSKSKNAKIYYLENNTGKLKTATLADFGNELKAQKYAIALGFEVDGMYYSAEPKMVKD